MTTQPQYIITKEDYDQIYCIQYPLTSEERRRICERSRRAPSAEPKFNSTDLLLLANDEWKRREERKHNHENAPWCAGFINGFLTDKKWAREMVDKIQKDAEDKRRSKAGAP